MDGIEKPMVVPARHDVAQNLLVADKDSPKPKPKAGNTGDRNTTWSDTPVPIEAAPLQLRAIDTAANWVVAAHRMRAAALEVRKIQPDNAAYVEAYDKAVNMVSQAEAELGKAIEREAQRLSRQSSFYPGRSNPADVRKVEALIDLAYAEVGDREIVIRDAIRDNQFRRLPFELGHVSNAMKHGLGLNQESERIDIINDASNWVAEPRAADGADAILVRRNQFARLEELLDAMTTRTKDFDKDLFAAVVIRCATDMGLSSPQDLKNLREKVRAYNSAEVDGWIEAQLPRK